MSGLVGLLGSISNGFSVGSISAGSAAGGRLSSSPKCLALPQKMLGLIGLLVFIFNGFLAGLILAGSAGGGRLSSSQKCIAHLFNWSLWFVCTLIFAPHWSVCYLWLSCQPSGDFIHVFHISFSSCFLCLLC